MLAGDYASSMVPEAPLEPDAGLVPKGDGWFVLNANDARWYHAEGRPAVCDLEGDTEFSQLGIYVYVLQPGEATATASGGQVLHRNRSTARRPPRERPLRA